MLFQLDPGAADSIASKKQTKQKNNKVPSPKLLPAPSCVHEGETFLEKGRLSILELFTAQQEEWDVREENDLRGQ